MAFFRVFALLHFFCFLLLAFTTPRAQARESQFFSKAERYTAPKEASTPAKGEELPAAKKDEEVQYKPDNGGGGYGLYGHAPERNPAATTARPAFPTYGYNEGAGEKSNTESVFAAKKDEEVQYYKPDNGGLYGHGPERIPAATTASPAFPTYGYNQGAVENSNTESVPAEFNNEEVDGAVSYGNKEFSAAGDQDMNKNYAGKTPTYNAGSINPQKYELDGYKYNKEASTRYVPNRGEQYGMSDTRFLDNGRYFYDQKAEQDMYRNGRYGDVEPSGGKYPGGAYGSFGGGQTFANGGYTVGGNSINSNDNNGETSGYEENNSVQGYRSNHQQEEYVP